VVLFLIGIPLNIVISVMIVILTPSIQRWWEKRDKTSHARTLRRIKAEYDDAVYYAVNKDFLSQKLILRTMGMVLYGIYLVLLVKIEVTHPVSRELFKVLKTPDFVRDHSLFIAGAFDVFELLLMLCFIVATAFTLTLLRQSMTLVHHVQFLEIYVESVPDEIRNKKREALAITLIDDRYTPSYFGMLNYEKRKEAIEGATPSLPSASLTSTAEAPEIKLD
jgi:hypothetical protein